MQILRIYCALEKEVQWKCNIVHILRIGEISTILHKSCVYIAHWGNKYNLAQIWGNKYNLAQILGICCPLRRESCANLVHLLRIDKKNKPKETLENIETMNKIRSIEDLGMNVYKKYEVWKEEDEVSGLPMDPSIEQVVTINGKGEKEVTKLMCLYLWHRGEIFQIQESNRGANVVVCGYVKTVKFRCWKTKEGFYLETYFCKLVSICTYNSVCGKPWKRGVINTGLG